MKNYVEISLTPESMIVEGRLGLQNVYKIKRVFTPVGTVDLSRNRYYYSKEVGGVVSCRGRSSKASELTLDKNDCYTFSEKDGKGFTRPFKVHLDQLLAAASTIL
jgi:hypothetical protein